MATIISTLNQKGGVGKTTTTHHVAKHLGEMGNRVLLVDMDITQGSLTKSTIGDISEKGLVGIGTLLATNVSIDKSIHSTKMKNVDIVPVEGLINGMKINIEHVLYSRPNPSKILAQKFDNPLMESYDYVLIDTGPTLNQTTINSLVASDAFVVSFMPADMTMDGFRELMATASQIRNSDNSGLKFLGVILCMVDKRVKLLKETRETLKKSIGDLVFDTEISTNATYNTLRRNNNTIWDRIKIGGKKHPRNEKSANQYADLTSEITARIRTLGITKSRQRRGELRA